MAQNQNQYLADLREMQFVLFEQFGLGELLTDPMFSNSIDEPGARMGARRSLQVRL